MVYISGLKYPLSLLKVIWEEVRVAAKVSPHLLQRRAPNLPTKIPLSWDRSPNPPHLRRVTTVPWEIKNFNFRRLLTVPVSHKQLCPSFLRKFVCQPLCCGLLQYYNTTCLIPGPVQPMMLNGIRIRSTVFPQCTGQTDTRTDRQIIHGKV